MTEHIISWSYSKLQDFEQCRLRAKIKYLDKVPEPPRLLKPGQVEHANDRGTRIHDSAERYVNGTGGFIPEMKHFRAEFEHMRNLYQAGKVALEGEWGIDRDWEPTEWRTAWQRGKLDALVHASDTEAVVIDYKSGKRFGNEIKHGEQVNLYGLLTFLRYPLLETVHVELWYLDVDEITQRTFDRDQALRFKASFDRRGRALTECTTWPANPNKFSCQWCPYGPDGTGHCTVGVRGK
jgi:hypothetical protein